VVRDLSMKLRCASDFKEGILRVKTKRNTQNDEGTRKLYFVQFCSLVLGIHLFLI
jgi:hypothetical protein